MNNNNVLLLSIYKCFNPVKKSQINYNMIASQNYKF